MPIGSATRAKIRAMPIVGSGRTFLKMWPLNIRRSAKTLAFMICPPLAKLGLKDPMPAPS